MWRTPLLLSVLALGCEFDAFRDALLCSDDSPCSEGVCVQGLCQTSPEMAIVDAAVDATIDATRPVDAQPFDAQPQVDAQPQFDMTSARDAEPVELDQHIDAAPPPDMRPPEPEPDPEPPPEPEPEPFGFTGPECGSPTELCVAVAADTTIRMEAPQARFGERAGPELVLSRDAQYGERADILVGFALRPDRIADAIGLELLLPRSGRGERYPLPTDATHVSTAWNEATAVWDDMHNRGRGFSADGTDEGPFVVFPLDQILADAQMGNGRFSVQLLLREDGEFRFFSRETNDTPSARLRFRFGPE